MTADRHRPAGGVVGVGVSVGPVGVVVEVSVGPVGVIVGVGVGGAVGSASGTALVSAESGPLCPCAS